MKCKQLRPGIEHGSPFSFPMTVTITLQTPLFLNTKIFFCGRLSSRLTKTTRGSTCDSSYHLYICKLYCIYNKWISRLFCWHFPWVSSSYEFSNLVSSPVDWGVGVEYTDCISAEGLNPHNECPTVNKWLFNWIVCDIKQYLESDNSVQTND